MAQASSQRSAQRVRPKRSGSGPASCITKGCEEEPAAHRLCDAHLRARRPAEWAKLHKLIGKAEPRLWTKPLRPLTRKTTLGYEIIDFARDVLGEPLLPWQEWLVIHAMELLPDGTPRFRTVLSLVARQNGKTHLSVVVGLWRLYCDGAKLVLGTAQDLSIAREVLEKAEEFAETIPELAEEIDVIRKANGDEHMRLVGGGRWIIKASNRKAGRGLSVDHLTMDELREQRDFAAWSALSKTINARSRGQIWCLSNAGEDDSVVLNQLRDAALAEADDSLGIFEWSAPEGCELDDREAWMQANPALGHTMSEAALKSALGTDPPEVFRTEVLCQKVSQINAAIDAGAWKACADPKGSMDELREKLVACIDVSPDGQHVTLGVAAETTGNRYRVEVAQAWHTVDSARQELPGWLKKIKPVALAWFPGGPANALATELRAVEDMEIPVTPVPVTSAGAPRRPKTRKLKVIEITMTSAQEACQAFADLVSARKVLHPNDPLLNSHIAGAQKWNVGDGWRFVRRGAGQVDAAYAAAGALHTLRTMPAEKPKLRPMVLSGRVKSA